MVVLDLIGKKISEEVQIRTEPSAMEEDAPGITCRTCQARVTRPEFRIEINRGFSHTFANPHGHVYEIGCFSRADGCVKFSGTSDEFSWFKGYVWAVGLCRNCRVQLGWVFIPVRPGDLDKFYGLILDQLQFP